MKKRFYKTCELNGLSYVKIPIRSFALLNIENDNKYCLIWSILASFHPCNKDHSESVSNYRQNFDELSIEGFDPTNGFMCSDVQKFAKLNNLSIIIFELNFYQDQNKWKHNLIPIEISENDESNKVADLSIYKNHYTLIKKFNVFLGDLNKYFVCRRCLNSYTSENLLMILKTKCEINVITTIRNSSESYLHWKDHFHKKPLYFRIYADFEVDNDIDNFVIGTATTNIFKQNQVLNGYYTKSEFEDVLKSDYYKSPLGYHNVDWYVIQVIK